MYSIWICGHFKYTFFWIYIVEIRILHSAHIRRSHISCTIGGSQYRVPCCRSCAHPCTPQFQPKQPIHSLSPPSMLCQWLSLRLPPFLLSWWLHKNLNPPPRFWARKWSTNGEYIWVQGRRSGRCLEDAWWRGMRGAKGALLGLRVWLDRRERVIFRDLQFLRPEGLLYEKWGRGWVWLGL